MTLHEAQEHLSRYLAEARVRRLSNEEERRMEEIRNGFFVVEFSSDGIGVAYNHWSHDLIREFRRDA